MSTDISNNQIENSLHVLPGIEQVLSLSELCEHLHIPAQTLYDLRSQGRGPRGFRVGRELRFRVGEVQAWLARLEDEDEHRHDGHDSDATGEGGR